MQEDRASPTLKRFKIWSDGDDGGNNNKNNNNNNN